MKKNYKNLFICILTCIFLILGCDGGSRIVGNVYDTENKPIENAEIKFEQIEKGETKESYQCSTKTDKDGKFGCGFTHAPKKVQLKLTVSKNGYKTYETEFSSIEAKEKMGNGSGFKIILSQ